MLPGLIIDGSNLYALSAPGAGGAGSQVIWRVPKDGSPPVQLASSPTPLTGLTLAMENLSTTSGVIWSTAGDGGAEGGAAGALLSVGLDGGGAPVVLAAGRQAPIQVVSFGTQVYWAEQSVDDLGNPVEAIMALSTAGGPATLIQKVGRDEAPTALGAIFWGFGTVEADGTFIPSGALYWTTWDPQIDNAASAEIVICPVPGPFGPLTRLGGPDAGGAGAIAYRPYSGGFEYSSADGVINSVAPPSSDAGWVSQPIATTPGLVDGLVDDGSELFFVQPGTSTLVAIPRSAGDAQAPRVVARGVDPSFLLDDVCVYWVDTDAGTLAMEVR